MDFQILGPVQVFSGGQQVRLSGERQCALLAYLLIRLSGVDREVMEKWLYVIVGLTFISGLLGTAHHYYYVGTPSYWLPIGGFFSALEPAVFIAMSAYAYSAIRRSGVSHPNTLALHWTLGSAGSPGGAGAGEVDPLDVRRDVGGARSTRRGRIDPPSCAPAHIRLYGGVLFWKFDVSSAGP